MAGWTGCRSRLSLNDWLVTDAVAKARGRRRLGRWWWRGRRQWRRPLGWTRLRRRQPVGTRRRSAAQHRGAAATQPGPVSPGHAAGAGRRPRCAPDRAAGGIAVAGQRLLPGGARRTTRGLALPRIGAERATPPAL